MNGRRLAVSLPGRDVGVLEQSRSGITSFVPDPAWDRDDRMPRLGLDFLRNRAVRSHASELPAWFENLLPERDSKLRWRLAAAHHLREGQSFALLGVLGRDLIGAAEARPIGQSAIDPQSVPPDEAPAAGAPPPPLRMSALTGLQLKFSMSMVDDRLFLAAAGSGRQWIVKLAGPEHPELAEVEAATMTWAKAAGFDVPEHWTVPFDRLDGIPDGWAESAAPALAVLRFDRRADGSKIHQEDLCQALDQPPRNKYGEGPPIGFEGALRLVHDACGDADAREMARRIGFMIASGNGDAHLKNWTLVWGDRIRPALAPCYDLVCTIAWERLGWSRPRGPELALRLGGTSLFARLDEARLDAFAAASYPWAKDEVLRGIALARDAWAEAAQAAPRRMREALGVHWARVPLLETFGAFDG